MVKVTLLSALCTTITVSCSECFQYPLSSRGGRLLVILLCVYLSVPEKHLTVRSLGEYHLSKAHIHPLLICSMMEIPPSSLKKQTFSTHEET